jgi:hypothetical protein
MNLVAIEAPPAGVAPSRKLLEFRDAPLRIIAPSQPLQVVPNELIETLAQSIRLLSGAGDKLLIDG